MRTAMSEIELRRRRCCGAARLLGVGRKSQLILVVVHTIIGINLKTDHNSTLDPLTSRNFRLVMAINNIFPIWASRSIFFGIL